MYDSASLSVNCELAPHNGICAFIETVVAFDVGCRVPDDMRGVHGRDRPVLAGGQGYDGSVVEANRCRLRWGSMLCKL